jgi:hypothetical protein
VAHVAPISDDQNPKMTSTAEPWSTPVSLQGDRWPSVGLPPSPSASIWTDAAFLHYRAANVLLRITVWLFSHRLAPRSVLEGALTLSSHLKDRGAYFHAQLRWRRLRDRL